MRGPGEEEKEEVVASAEIVGHGGDVKGNLTTVLHTSINARKSSSSSSSSSSSDSGSCKSWLPQRRNVGGDASKKPKTEESGSLNSLTLA